MLSIIEIKVEPASALAFNKTRSASACVQSFCRTKEMPIMLIRAHSNNSVSVGTVALHLVC
jgi:hypothetical protein